MTTPTLIDLMHRHYALIDGNDVAGLAACYARDVAYHRPGYPPLTGRTELARFYREVRVIREGRHDLETVVADGTGIAVHGTFTGVLRDGRPAAHRFAEFFVVDADGLIARRDTFFFVPLV
ncbi:MAG TPA: nuclear transport factor 2 family protein [Pseudonocardiaceae bacterium]|jgi:ketosteroid isomerase-like protein|nr:nuclear transport factor 2 family protein [Pseudonocardiaceae bacterium]